MVMLQELDSNQTSGNVSVNNDRSSDGRGVSAVSNEIQNPESLVQIQTANKNEEIRLPKNFPYPPLDLNFTNPPSSLDVAIIKQTIANRNTLNNQNAISSMSDCRQKLNIKASNLPFSVLKIGVWVRVARNEGDLVVKVYFSKKRLVWEILEHCLKKKIEILWDQIVGMKALIEPNKPAILEIELSEPPIFAHETDPKPRKHTIWRPTQDFTNDQASICRIHHLEIPPGVINKDFEKLLRVYPRFIQLIQRPFPSLSSPYFTSTFVQGNCSRMPSGFRAQPSIQWNYQETGCKMNPDYIAPTNMPQNFRPPTNMPQNFRPPTNMPQNFRPPTNMPQNFKPPTSMCFELQDNKGQTNGCEMAPELRHPANSHFGIQGNWQHMDPECRAHKKMCFYTQDNGEGNGFEIAPELEHPANIHFAIQGNSQDMILEYKPPINNDFGIEENRQHNFCDISLEYKAPINMDFQQKNSPGLGIATNSVAPTYVPIHGNRYEVDSFKPAAYPSIPAIDSVPPGQTYEQINGPFLIDSSQRSDEGISNHIVDNTSMSSSVQGMKRLQNHHQNCNLPITHNKALESLNAHMVSNIEKHLMDDSDAQYIDTQNLQGNSENSMHSMNDLHSEMNLAVAPVGNTPLYEIQMIPNENWVSNTTYYDGVGQQLQP